MHHKYATLIVFGLGVLSAYAGDNNVFVNTTMQQVSGEVVRGPATIHVTGLNPIRYNISIANTATYPAGPSLSGLPFIPPIPSGQVQVNQGGTPAPPNVQQALVVGGPPGTDQLFSSYINGPNGLNSLEQQRITVSSLINQMIGTLNQRATDVQGLAASTDQTLRTGDQNGPSDGAITDGILTPMGVLITGLTSAVASNWPYSDVDTLNTNLAALRNNLATLPALAADWSKWSAIADNLQVYNAAVSRVGELITIVTDLSSATNTSQTNFQTVKQQLGGWRDLLAAIRAGGPGSFRFQQRVSCSFAFDNTKETKLQLVTVDRFASAGAKPSTQELVTVTCSSPFSVSGGVGFSTLAERDIEFIPSSKTDGSGKTENVFGYQSQSRGKPIPLLLLNVRLWEPNDVFSIHFSGGAAVDIKTGAIGTDVEYVIGPSIAFRRSLFLTTGLHLGRTFSLSKESGFNIGDVVPAGLASPPVEKKWTPAFVIGVTWKIR